MPQQRALVDKVSAYLSRVHIMSGAFVQIGADGRRSSGNFYVQKPGKVRFEYDAAEPDRHHRRRLVGGRARPPAGDPGSLSAVADAAAFPAGRQASTCCATPTSPSVTADELFVSIVVEEKQALIGTSRLMMMFDAKSLELRQWVVTDPQGFDTTIAVSNLDSNRRPDPALFRIDYTDYRRDR